MQSQPRRASGAGEAGARGHELAAVKHSQAAKTKKNSVFLSHHEDRFDSPAHVPTSHRADKGKRGERRGDMTQVCDTTRGQLIPCTHKCQ